MFGKNPSCKTPFQHLHTVEFGLQITGQDAKSQVVSVLCRFWTSFKKTEKEGAKCQRTDNTKYYSTPFHKENHDKNNCTQHSIEWEQFKKILREEKI